MQVAKRDAIVGSAVGLVLGWLFYGPLPKWLRTKLHI